MMDIFNLIIDCLLLIAVITSIRSLNRYHRRMNEFEDFEKFEIEYKSNIYGLLNRLEAWKIETKEELWEELKEKNRPSRNRYNDRYKFVNLYDMPEKKNKAKHEESIDTDFLLVKSEDIIEFDFKKWMNTKLLKKNE